MEKFINNAPFALVLVCLIIGFVLLIKGADFFVEGSSSVAKRLHVPSIIIGLTIVAMGTSLPETAVSVSASITGNNELAVSNVVGSNIFNLMVVIGVCAMIATVNVAKETIKRDIPFSLICAGLLLILGILGVGDKSGMMLGHFDGVIFIGAFAGYIGALSNKIVPLIIHSHTESGLFQNLLAAYRPEYLWLPERLGHEYGSEVIFGFKHYILVKTGMTPPPLYKELSLLLPTSGSTGSSKLVRHSYKNVEANARNVSLLFGLDKHERALAALPIYYTMGLSVISSHIYAGATILLTGKSLTDGKFWTFMKEHRATSFTGVPYSFEVLQKLRFFRMDLPHLQLITQGGGKMDEKLFRTCAGYAEKNGKKFIATYGQTEGTARMAYLPAHLASSKICSIGRAIPNGELSLVDEQGKLILEKEATGQLIYKGPNVTLGYAFSADDLIRGDENQGVLFTGDLARRDADGCYYIIGRIGRFLKLFGLRVGLDECERIIKAEYNLSCACTGTDKGMYVYITDGKFTDKVLDLLIRKTHIIASAFKVIVIPEIPKNEAGKILYSKLIKE